MRERGRVMRMRMREQQVRRTAQTFLLFYFILKFYQYRCIVARLTVKEDSTYVRPLTAD